MNKYYQVAFVFTCLFLLSACFNSDKNDQALKVNQQEENVEDKGQKQETKSSNQSDQDTSTDKKDDTTDNQDSTSNKKQSSSADGGGGASGKSEKPINNTGLTVVDVNGTVADSVLANSVLVEIKLANLKSATAKSIVFLKVDQELLPLEYHSERKAFNNIKLTGFSIEQIEKAEIVIQN